MTAEHAVVVIGVGADGFDGLGAPARQALEAARVVLGSTRQLDLLPAQLGARRVRWPSPMLPALPGLLAEHAGATTCVLASGDPMFFGVGTTIARILGADRVRVLPHASSVSLACARLGWAVQDTTVLSALGRPLDAVHAVLAPGRQLLVLCADGDGPGALATTLTAHGWGPSRLTVLERLGGEDERIASHSAESWPVEPSASLNLVAVEPAPAPGTIPRSRVPGLPDDAYEHDGQLSKREVRALTLAMLAPMPGELLWDVGAGAGSIGIEWMRAETSCQAIAVESVPTRADRITANATNLGTPGLRVVTGSAPAALQGLPAPDAVFVGGGSTEDGVIESCVDALRPGGRLVANAVTVESERVLTDASARLGGELRRIELSRIAPVGGFTAWRAALPITQWTLHR